MNFSFANTKVYSDTGFDHFLGCLTAETLLLLTEIR